MDCFIKERKTFKTIAVCPVLDYAMTVKSIFDEISSFLISIDKEKIITVGDYLVTNEYIGIITGVSRGRASAKISCEDIIKLFSRPQVYTAKGTATIEAYIESLLTSSYKENTDVIYQLPFLEIEKLTDTASAIEPDVDQGIWNLKSFLAKVRRVNNVFVDFEATKNTLKVTIQKKAVVTKNLDLSMPTIEIEEESYSNKQLGKITTIETGGNRDWYLLTDGTITNDYQATDRIDGELMVINLADDADGLSEVQNIFFKNTYSHKILFSTSNARFEFYDRLRISSDGKLFSSYISAIRKKKSSLKTTYLCGEMRTQFTDKIVEEI
ncbi:MAG: hypothetical protein GX928_02540 [Ruminococcaceae bacterium]|nr:hypothetical protein [Oscillospiraceae bacterium]